MALAVGIDIGGTKIATALVNERGETLASAQLPTSASEGVEAVISRVVQGAAQMLEKASEPVAGIGIGVPGHVNPHTGVVRNAVNLGWDEVPLVDEVRKRVSIPVWLEKDANALALGEMYFGAARGCQDFVYIAIGTGLGGGAVVNGQVVGGANTNAMEIGHLSFDPKGRLCVCGLHGCVEMYVSGHGMVAGIEEHRPEYPQSILTQATTAALLEAAQQKDPLALKVLMEAGEWLGVMMACCAGLFNPAMFVMAGGLGQAAADFVLPVAKAELARRVLPATLDKLEIVESRVTSSAVGAASLVWHHQSGGGRDGA